jgi:hypothetical protein
MLRSKRPEPTTEDNRMETTELPSAPIARTRRPLGDISNFAAQERVMDVKRTIQQAPPLPEAYTEVVPIIPMAVQMDDDRLYMRREADNIDIRDVDNPLLCTEVVNDMYDNFRRIEMEIRVDNNYMTTQPHVNDKMRAILVDWLVSAAYIFL